METNTLSKLVTPTPTWTTIPVSTSQQINSNSLPVVNSLQNLSPLNPIQFPNLWPKVAALTRKVDPKTGREQADVLEVEKTTSPVAAKDKLDRLKQAYGILYANTKRQPRRSFGVLNPRISSSSNHPRNPIFDSKGDDGSEVEVPDQQVLPAQLPPVVVKNTALPRKEKPEPTQITPEPSVLPRVFTLYFSGKSPGEYTTRVTTLLPGEDAPTTGKRKKRSNDLRRDQNEINPTPAKLFAIERTEPVIELMATFSTSLDESILEPSLASPLKPLLGTSSATESLPPLVVSSGF